MRIVSLVALAVFAGVACTGGSAQEVEPECATDTDCESTQICGEEGVHNHLAGECMWVSGHPFAMIILSAEVHVDGPDEGTTWDEEAFGPLADPRAGLTQGEGELVDCTGYVGESHDASFGTGTGQDCYLTVFPGQPLTLYLYDWDPEEPAYSGGDTRQVIESWTFEGEEGYAQLLREPSTQRLVGDNASIFVQTVD